MNKTAEKLMAYRKGNKVKDDKSVRNISPSSSVHELENKRGIQRSPGIWQRLNIDILDAPPLRTWRKCLETNPRSTLVATFLVYLIGQIYFVWLQFGLVFFAFSILAAICLSLGNRSEGEMSAYSVFNPNCERLLGQMTAEHFERDVLRRRID
ncbi:hypothetical protein RB195_014678 [Necator americanus]|uniref:SAYSvFN domain-containing protein n=1 Tax=Necator americanus TaxID=51031 RepID=A0ABR1E144_NECAM